MKPFLLSALGIFLFSNVSAANIESVFLPKDMNQCIRSLELPQSIHTERIEQDRLGGSVYVNPFRNVENMLYFAEAGNTGCGQRVLRFIRNANTFYQDYNVYCVFGSRNGTEARNQMNHFEKQKEFMVCGL